MKAPVSTAIAIAVGILILLGYFIPIAALLSLRVVLVQWAIILASFALLVGISNLARVHWAKLRKGGINAVYSAILLLSLFATLIVVGFFGPTNTWSVWIFNNIQLPIESSLMALLAVVLLLAGARLFSRRLDLFSIVFIVTGVIVLLGTTPFFFVGDIPGLNILRTFIAQVPAVAGARGIIIGVALGTIVTGVRILLGADRPYSG